MGGTDKPSVPVLFCERGNKVLKKLAPLIIKQAGNGQVPSETELERLCHEKAIRLGEAIHFEAGGIIFTIVGNPEKLSAIMEATRPKSVPVERSPYYALVVYSAGAISNSPGWAATMRAYDYFLPQMVFGKIHSTRLVAAAALNGISHFVEGTREAERHIRTIFIKPEKIPNLTLVKIGGSAFDYDRQFRNRGALEEVCLLLVRNLQDREDRMDAQFNRMIVTAGTGQHGDVVRDYTRKYGRNPKVLELHPELIAKTLHLNLEALKPLFYGDAELLPPNNFSFINRNRLTDRIPLVGVAPHYIAARDGIPLKDSDTHTVALAEFYGATRIILIKRTDGIYKFDPMRGFVLDPRTGKCANYDAWKKAQEGNQRFEVVAIDQLLGTEISREGTSFLDGRPDKSTGHLMEDSALRYMQRYAPGVKEVLVVHLAPEEMYEQIGPWRYRHVITGGEAVIDPKPQWLGILEQRLKEAFNGKSKSKIVRELTPAPVGQQ